MGDPVRLLLTNAAYAGLIALVAWAASRVVRRPAVVHGLWLLALVRLLTPPIAPLPLLPAWTGLPLVSAPPTPTVVVIPSPRADALASRLLAPVEASTVGPPPPETARAASTVASQPAKATLSRPAGPGLRIDWRAAAWALLASSALAIAALAAWRSARFGRLLACARPAPPTVADRSSALAAQLGLRRAPPVLLLPARIPPMLWPQRGGPLLLLPEKLLAELRGDELDALLAHELAHVRRRDHWVRLLEIAATALFWWYPVTWWARRALRRTEERCCDEWVLRLLPRSAEAYANGLLKSLTFVAESPLPAVASGLGPVDDLESRLKEILMTRPVPQLAAPLRLALASVAALSLAVFPTHAQSSAAKDDPAATTTAAPAASAETPAPAAKPSPAKKATAPAVRARATTPAPIQALVGGVPGGVAGGVPGGVLGGVPGALTPRPGLMPLAAPLAALALTPQATPAPAPAIAAGSGHRDAAHRAIEEKRRAIEEQRRQLHQQQLELEGRQIELEAQAEQAELRAEADRLRAEGSPEDVARVEKRVQLNARRFDLQKRQLQLEVEHATLEAKLEAEMRAHQDRLEAAEESGQEKATEEVQREMERADAARQHAEQELEKKQQAIESEVAESEKEERALAAEEQVRAVRDATDDLARSIADQIDSLKQALAEAPAQKVDVDREIQRLQAALDALKADGASKALPRKTPRP